MPTTTAHACQNPSHPSGIGSVHCDECTRWFCRGHAQHPAHVAPIDEAPAPSS